MIRRAVTVGATLLLLLASIGGGPVIAGDQPDDQSAIIAANNVAEDQAYADKFGTSTDEATARRLDRRAIDESLAVWRERGDEFTGVYFTHTADAYTLHIVVKEGVDATLDLPQTETITTVYETAPRSWNELLDLQAQVAGTEGIGHTWPEITTGQLDIEASGTVAEQLTSQYGDAVNIVAPQEHSAISCATRTSCSDVRGGIQLYPSDDSGDICTLGFIAASNSNGHWKALTAGHCGTEDGWENTNSGFFIGATQTNCWAFAACRFSDYDVQAINCANNTTCHTPRNCVWSSGSGNCYAITGVKGGGFINLGDVMTQTAWDRGPLSSQVSHVHLNMGHTCFFCDDDIGFATNVGMHGGDSGSPAAVDNKAAGMAVGSDGDNSGETDYAYANDGASNGAQYFLDVSICTTSSC